MFRYTHIAVGDIRHYRLRSALSIAGIAVVVAVFVVLSAAATGMGQAMAGTQGSPRNLALVDKGVVDFCQGNISAGLVARLRRWPGVAYVAPMLHLVLQIDGQLVQVRTVPLDTYQVVEGAQIIAGEGLRRGDYAIVGEYLARLNGWQPGDTVEIAGTELEIIGVFRAPGSLNTELWLTLEDGERLFDRQGSYSIVVVQAEAGQGVEALAQSLQGSRSVARQVDVASEQAVYDKMNQAFQQMEQAMQAVSLLALLVIVFGIFNVVSMTTAEKTREIGILKAVGLSQREVMGIYLLEGLILTTAGHAIGVAVGAGVVAWLAKSSAVALLSVPLTPVLTPQSIFVSAGLTAVLSLLGAWWPARDAAAVPVAEALRAV